MIYIASDYAGYKLKEKVKSLLSVKKIIFADLGCDSDRVKNDFPEFARQVAWKVKKSKTDLGILVCGAGYGMCIAANRFRGIRAASVFNAMQARYSKTHDNANILCLSRWMTEPAAVKGIINTWLAVKFQPLARRVRRFKIIDRWPQ
ncbi:MAG: RpiB/LacA/LacB family sugar-phosphate isomerase [Patescibacteria group bacterium]